MRADRNAIPKVRSGSTLLRYIKSFKSSTVAVNVLPVDVFRKKLYILTSSVTSDEMLSFSKACGKAGDMRLGKHGIGAQNETLKTTELTTFGFTWTRRWKCRNTTFWLNSLALANACKPAYK